MKVIWLQNNLRIRDNDPLLAACDAARRQNTRVMALYCVDPEQFRSGAYGLPRIGKYRARFLLESLADLQQQLLTLNIPLYFALAEPAQFLSDLLSRGDVTGLYLQKEWTRDERQTMDRVRGQASKLGVEVHEYFAQFLIHPEDLPFSLPELPRMFTAFRKTCERQWAVRAELPAPAPLPRENLVAQELMTISTTVPPMETLGLSSPPIDARSAFPFAGGETAAWHRIQTYFWDTQGLACYKQTRNGLLGTEYSSKLSPWLANGCISPRQIYWQVQKFERDVLANEDTYWMVFELLWRDFFKYVSQRYGDRIFALGGILGRDYEWHRDDDAFDRWINGETPYDFVNANMREIAATGWMSNRGRQNVASYWARELGQDWRVGAAYFESLLVDYDVHSNYGNWMYCSGVGNDPRDRRFNIASQAERYDADGHYRRLWLGTSG